VQGIIPVLLNRPISGALTILTVGIAASSGKHSLLAFHQVITIPRDWFHDILLIYNSVLRVRWPNTTNHCVDFDRDYGIGLPIHLLK
jgi:hypothetical protein